jgi:GNAT superfamily N-acetyltransferase
VFGFGYHNSTNLKLNSERIFNLIVKVGIKNVGFGIGMIADNNQRHELFMDSADLLPQDIKEALQKGKLGVIKTLAISKAYQNKGFGGKLFRALESRLKGAGVKKIIVPAWKDNKQIFLSRLLERNSYSPLIEIPMMWQGICDSGEYKCISRCDQCVCSAVYYTNQ